MLSIYLLRNLIIKVVLYNFNIHFQSDIQKNKSVHFEVAERSRQNNDSIFPAWLDKAMTYSMDLIVKKEVIGKGNFGIVRKGSIKHGNAM